MQADQGMRGPTFIGLSQVTDETFEEEIIQSTMPALVDFWAEWCEPCKAMLPIVEELAKRYQGKIKFAQMNVVNNRSIPARFLIRSLPTFILYKGGQVRHTMIGAVPRSLLDEELRNLL
jgi:thioredoxin 1